MNTDDLATNDSEQQASSDETFALSQEERNLLQTEIKQLEARIETSKEDIRAFKRHFDRATNTWAEVRKAIETGDECIRCLKDDDDDDDDDEEYIQKDLEKFPLLERQIKDLRSRKGVSQVIQGIKNFLDKQEELRQENENELKQLRDSELAAIKDRKNLEAQLAEKQMLLRRSTGKFGHGNAKASLTGKKPNPKRKQRWIELNRILELNAKKLKTNDSTTNSHVTWNQVKSLFNPTNYVQPRSDVDDEEMDFLEKYI